MDTFYNENGGTVQNTVSDTKTPPINPQNPFENFTEYEDYNSDYREIVPQIDIPGCVIPFEPSAGEKSRIRRYFNLTGAGLLLHFLISTGLVMILQPLITNIVMKIDGVKRSEVTVQYARGFENFFSSSSVETGLNLLIIMFCNLLIFFVGAKLSGIRPGSCFRTKGFTLKHAAGYCLISFFIRISAGILYQIYMQLFPNADFDVGASVTQYQTTGAIILAMIYGCIVAPITEELIYRGFVLKNLSRVSQRFGIFMSALIFGFTHCNLNQFFFAFFAGIFLAHIDIKHDSLIPSIIVHMFANSFSLIITYSGLLNDFFYTALISFTMLVLGFAGMIVWIIFIRRNRIPYSMPHQSRRNATLISSPVLVLTIVLYLLITLFASFPSLTEKFTSLFK